MLSLIKSEFYFRKSRFYEFLVESRGRKSSKSIWALYKLGKYASVIKCFDNNYHQIKLDRRSLIALAASYAACGDYVRCEEKVKSYEILYASDIEDLIAALVPFYAPLAMSLVDKYQVINLCTVVLSFHQQRYKKASKDFEKIQPGIDFQNYYLAKAFISSEHPQQVLSSFNEIMRNFDLALIEFQDKEKGFQIENIISKPLVLSEKNIGLISIIMTCYNAEKYLRLSLDSLLNQSYTYFEIIVVDDASTDNSWLILEDYARKDSRVKILKQVANAGTYVAKNTALELAKGEFVMCHDVDDWSHPQRLEKQVAPFEQNKDLICTVSNWVRVCNAGQLYARSIYPISRLNPSSPMFKRDLIVKHLGGWDSVRIGADTEFLNRIKLKFGHNAVHKVKLPLSIGAHRQDSLMNASDTGFKTQVVPDKRLEYWEAWSDWHIESLKNKDSFYIPPFVLSKERPYTVPKSIMIQDEILSLYR